MKKTLLLLILLLTQTIYSQIVTIPDANFKAALIAANVDTNNDGEIQVSEAEAMTFININDKNISSLEGISSFINLTTLYCVRNNISSLDVSSLSNLNNLYCGSNQMTTLNISGLSNLLTLDISDNLISSFDRTDLSSLSELNWSNNQLTTIDVSSLSSLNELNCSNNQLATIDVSSLSSLNELNCSNNQLTTVDVSSLSNLQKLYCGENPFTSLDASGLLNLNYLDCYRGNLSTIDLSNSQNLNTLILTANQLTTLDITTLTNLMDLDVGGNHLTSLDLTNSNQLLQLDVNENNLNAMDVSGLTNLIYLYCRNNSITELDISNLHNLAFLDCSNNQLVALDASNKINLKEFYCNDNQLTTLNISGSSKLERLDVYDNLLTSLDVSEQQSLLVLNCHTNQLTSLDVSMSPILNTLICGSNQLTTINIKNGSSIEQNRFYIQNNPTLQFICVDPDERESIQSVVNSHGYTNCVVNPFCTFEPGGDIYYVQGNVKVDLNTDGCDVNDIVFPFLKLKVTKTNGDTVTYSTDVNGAYDIALPAGSYNVEYQFPYMSYFDISPTTFSVNFPTDNSPLTQDICLTPNGTYNDLQVGIIPIEQARPGFDARYKIVYANVGTIPLSGNVQFTFQDDVLDYVSSSVSPDTQSTGELNWAFANLAPLEFKSIEVTMNLNSPMEVPPLNGGEILCYEAIITPVTNDQRTNDNTFTLKQTVVNSYDPNDKTCLEGNTVTPDLIGEYVHYLIRFENTGTASAINVVVKDIIDTSKFDVESMVIYDSSHELVARIQNTNEVEFIFEGINLPFDDANNDGYIAFKIKTLPSLQVGDVFENNAEIYFDFNFPIITNMEQTTIETTAGVDEFSLRSNISVYPNPTKNLLHIQSELVFDTVIIYDLKGRQLHMVNATTPLLTKELDISNLAGGIYYLAIQSEASKVLKKIIKE